MGIEIRDHGVGTGVKLTGDALPAHVINGKKFLNASGEQTGGMSERAGIAQASLQSSRISSMTGGVVRFTGLLEGHYDAATQVGITISGLSPDVIRAGRGVGFGAGSDLFPERNMVGTFSADATADSSSILSGLTAYINGVKVTGGMPNRGAQSFTPSASAQGIPFGYYNGSGRVEAVSNLSAGNIKQGSNVGGVQGNFTADATAAANAILIGETAYVNGQKTTGTMPWHTGDEPAIASVSAPGILYLRPAPGYWTGGNHVYYQDGNFNPGNIRGGTWMFGLLGTLNVGTAYRSGDVTNTLTASNGYWKISVRGLPFRPNFIMADCQGSGGMRSSSMVLSSFGLVRNYYSDGSDGGGSFLTSSLGGGYNQFNVYNDGFDMIVYAGGFSVNSVFYRAWENA